MIYIPQQDSSVFEKICKLTEEKILEYKLACEANVVSILYKYPDLFEESELTINDFDINCWKVFFETARLICEKEEKNVIDEVTFGLFLEKHKKLMAKINEYGGYDMIVEASKYVKRENFDGYKKELLKWKTILLLNRRGYPVYDRLSDFADMKLDEIYNEYEAFLNDTFVNTSSNYSVFDITDGIYDLIDELDKGLGMGLPYYNLPILTQEVGGQNLGDITLIGGLSNMGKSTFLRNAFIPSILENNEKAIIMINEEDLKKWQKELMVYVANNILKKELRKIVLKNGKFTVDNKNILVEAANWIVENTKNHTLTVIPFQSYKTSEVLKIIRKYSSLGVKYFALDTFKRDKGNVSDKEWQQLEQNMTDIMDVVKASNKNVHISVTFQLSKSSTRQRYYMQDNIGNSKNIINPAATCLMIRKVFDDERPGEKKELDIRDINGNKVFLKSDKNYQIVFIVKNRNGSANEFQVVIEHDMSRNIIREVGICNVPLEL